MMDFRLFEEMKLSKVAKVPVAYTRRVRWLPQIGDIVPNFAAETTFGPLGLHDWAEGAWVVLFSHPGAFTSICTTEMASLAAAGPDFRKRGVKLLGISASTAEEQRRWHADIAAIYGEKVRFPMIADPAGVLTGLFGMIHPKQAPDLAIRKSIIIGPDLVVRMIFEYPVLVGRSTDEMLRVIDALQTVEAYNVGIPADWEKGDDCLLLPEAMGAPRFSFGGAWTRVRSYLRVVSDPWRFRPAPPPGLPGAGEPDAGPARAPLSGPSPGSPPAPTARRRARRRWPSATR